MAAPAPRAEANTESRQSCDLVAKKGRTDARNAASNELDLSPIKSLFAFGPFTETCHSFPPPAPLAASQAFANFLLESRNAELHFCFPSSETPRSMNGLIRGTFAFYPPSLSLSQNFFFLLNVFPPGRYSPRRKSCVCVCVHAGARLLHFLHHS